MNVEQLVKEADILLESTSNNLNLPITNLVMNDIHKLNKFFIVRSRLMTTYQINHKNVNILNELFKINEQTQAKLKKLAKIYNALKDESPDDCPVSQKINIINNVNNNSPELRMFDSRLGFGIGIRDSGWYISCSEFHEGKVMEGKDFNEVAQSLIDAFKKKIFNYFGFKEGITEKSPEYKSYIKRTKEVINAVHTNNFRYKLASNLIKEVCDEMNIPTKDIDGELSAEYPNLKYIDSKNSFISIPYERKDFVKLMIDKICTEQNVKNDAEHLINLIAFFQNISTNKFDLEIQFNKVTKQNKMSNVYYTIKFGDLFSLCIGTKLLKVKNNSTEIYDESIPETTNGYNKTCKYAFYTNIDKRNKDVVYLTNNMNYVYEKMRSIIEKEINDKIDNQGKPIDSQQIEIYQMVII